MKRLLVAIDGSEGSNAAIDEALGLATGLGAEVTFVYVRKLPSAALGYPYYERIVSSGLDEARAVAAKAMEAAEAAGVDSDADILEGDPADEILSLADNRDVDAIVVGSRGFGALAGALLGSVSRAVVQHAHRPVLVAKQVPTRQRQVA